MKAKHFYKDIDKFRAYRNGYSNRRRERENKTAHKKYQRYTKEEKQMILEHKLPDSELAKLFGRNTESIGLTRIRIKKQARSYYE